jgi:hypothetical protein
VEIATSEVLAKERPSIVSMAPGVVEAPIPTFPPLVTWNAVEVAVPLVEEEMARSGMLCPTVERPAMERSAHGEEVPRPKRALVGSSARKLAEPREVAEV